MAFNRKLMRNKFYSYVFFICLILFSNSTICQLKSIERVDPTFWWVGMKNPEVQLMFYGEKIAEKKFTLESYNGVKISSISKVKNPNYLFVDLIISPSAQAGELTFSIDGEKIFYSLKNRESYKIDKINQGDVIYLLMPDRFSNGDSKNDSFSDMADPEMDRANPWLRHGGDLLGVENHLDYFSDLGITSLWLNPVTENDQYLTDEGGTMRSAYHGYGFTDHYHVDKRLGGNEAYISLINAAHKKGISIIQDAVYNHFGINHWILRDPPMKDWLNNWNTYTQTNYKDQALLDSHGSKFDKKQTLNGWFTSFLPDVNQKNPFVSKYLIQNAIWQTENFKLDGWRIDTYFYNDFEFMNRCNKALLDEFPDLFIFGESWVNSVANQAYFTKNNLNLPFKCNLPGTVDFQLNFSIISALNEPYGWNNGVQKLYQVLAQDYLYKNPEDLVIFLDNHDLDRFLSVVGEDQKKFKMGLAWLFTLRGIPQLYYGTEINVKNFKNPTDAEVRKDFVGGWPEDKINKFQREGRTIQENETYDFIKKLANLRVNSLAISKGDFLQFIPYDDGLYVYFRYFGTERIMVIANTADKEKIIDPVRFEEILKGDRNAIDMIQFEEINLKNLKIQAGDFKILKINND